MQIYETFYNEFNCSTLLKMNNVQNINKNNVVAKYIYRVKPYYVQKKCCKLNWIQ
jgi:hypothetical protein